MKLISILTLVGTLPLLAETLSIQSPDHAIRVAIEIGDGAPTYSVRYHDEVIIAPSQLGFVLKDAPALDGPFEVADRKTREIDESWQPVWGQFSSIRNHANELHLALVEKDASGRKLDLVFRVFDDGVGFRYEFPKQESLGEFNIVGELTTFTFTENPTTWWTEALPDTYERDYNETPLTDCATRGASTPVTLRTSTGTHVSLHEADLTDWAGMKLKRALGGSELSLQADLVPWFDSDIRVKARTPMVSPWRTITIGKSAADLVSSSLILNLNDPCEIEDTSWIQPTKFMGIWWGMITGTWNWELEKEPAKHGATTERAMRYIDACARNDIPALLIEGWCEGWEGDIPGWGDMDFTRPYPDFDIEKITAYGRSKGVSLIGHHETGGNITNYENQLPAAFEYYNKLGINRIKTGYVTGDIPLHTAGLTEPGREHHHGQFSVHHHQKVIEMAAAHHIMIDAHEPIKGSGLERTWPNFVAREGARGGEFNHFIGNPPSQTCILPFTRLLAGPMDYTPALFDCAYDPEKRFGTRCQQLSLMVTLFSPLVMAADFYQAYEHEPAAQFIRNVPVGKWDDTRVLGAEIGDYIVTARRQGENWFLGATNNEEARNLPVKLDFLTAERRYDIVLYTDGPGASFRDNPYPVEIVRRSVAKDDILDLDLASGGGAVAEFYPAGTTYTAPSGTAGEIPANRSLRLSPKHSDLPLTTVGDQVTQSAAAPSRSQDWTLRKLKSGNYQISQAGKCLTASNDQDGGKVVLKKIQQADPSQQWIPRHIVGSWFRLENASNQQLLSVNGTRYFEGAAIETRAMDWKPDQIWSIEEL